MTTRIRALTVILEGDPREDDIEDLIVAIKQLRGVAFITPVEHTADSVLSEQRAKIALRRKIYQALHEILDP